jgi:hypothetical protein
MRDLPVRLSAPPAVRAAALGITLAAAGCGDGAGTAAPEGGAPLLGTLVLTGLPEGVTAGTLTAGCSYDASTGWHTCPPLSLPTGTVVVRTVRYVDAAGAPQRAPDARTAAMIHRASITGTATASGPGESQQLAVNITREETVTGLDSPDRTLVQNGFGGGTETGTLVNSGGEYTVVKVTADTTRGITTRYGRYGASPSAAATWPSSGITIQNVRTTYTPKAGGAARVEVRRHTSEWIGGGKLRGRIVVDGREAMCWLIDYTVSPAMTPCAP